MALTKDFHIRHDAFNWKHDAEKYRFLSQIRAADFASSQSVP